MRLQCDRDNGNITPLLGRYRQRLRLSFSVAINQYAVVYSRRSLIPDVRVSHFFTEGKLKS
jgi:hypothetical protein